MNVLEKKSQNNQTKYNNSKNPLTIGKKSISAPTPLPKLSSPNLSSNKPTLISLNKISRMNVKIPMKKVPSFKHSKTNLKD